MRQETNATLHIRLVTLAVGPNNHASRSVRVCRITHLPYHFSIAKINPIRRAQTRRLVRISKGAQGRYKKPFRHQTRGVTPTRTQPLTKQRRIHGQEPLTSLVGICLLSSLRPKPPKHALVWRVESEIAAAWVCFGSVLGFSSLNG